jgi:hypothetical protein
MLTDAFRYMLMVVYYEDQGFWIEYYMPREITENFYTGCPMKAHIYLTAEQSQDNFSFLEKRSNFNGIKYSYFFKSLEEATTLSLDEFYQVFKNPENSACIMTPKELWQLP